MECGDPPGDNPMKEISLKWSVYEKVEMPVNLN